MRASSRKALDTGTIPSPRAFRAAATGIGQTLATSQRTGAIRAQHVVDSCDPSCAKTLPPSYPPRDPFGLSFGMTPSEPPAKPRPVATTRPLATDPT